MTLVLFQCVTFHLSRCCRDNLLTTAVFAGVPCSGGRSRQSTEEKRSTTTSSTRSWRPIHLFLVRITLLDNRCTSLTSPARRCLLAGWWNAILFAGSFIVLLVLTCKGGTSSHFYSRPFEIFNKLNSYLLQCFTCRSTASSLVNSFEENRLLFVPRTEKPLHPSDPGLAFGAIICLPMGYIYATSVRFLFAMRLEG